MSSFFSAIRRSSVLSRIRRTIFSGWEVREKILRPVIVNLLTALLIFFLAVVFKDPIYNYFAPQPVAKDWPIYCVLEPEVNKDGTVTADLFVLNLTSKKYLSSDLDGLAKQLSPSGGYKELSPLVEIAMKPNLNSEILKIEPDSDFNSGKGRASFVKIGPAHWQMRLEEIRDGGILKFVIYTTEDRSIGSRGNYESLPLTLTYARAR